jgi:hypothetical protein
MALRAAEGLPLLSLEHENARRATAKGLIAGRRASLLQGEIDRPPCRFQRHQNPRPKQDRSLDTDLILPLCIATFSISYVLIVLWNLVEVTEMILRLCRNERSVSFWPKV